LKRFSFQNPEACVNKVPGFLLFLFLFTQLISCKEPDLGLEVQDPADVVNLLRTDSLVIGTSLERQDSVRTDELSANLLGAYNDPLLGMMHASFCTQVVPTASDISLGEGFIADSIVLVIPYRGFYGDITKAKGLQKFSVYRVLDDLSLADVYYSNKQVSLSSQTIGETGFIVPLLTDSIPVTGIKQAPQLRIRLNNDIASEFVNNPDALLGIDAFRTLFKGVCVKAETYPTSGSGAIFDFVLTGGARMDLFYKNDANDSLLVSFVVNENCARFTQFNHNYSQHVTDLIANPALASVRSYSQTMAGLRTRIDLPNLKTWQNGRKILINEAKLHVPVATDELGIYAPNPQLDLVTKNSSGDLIQTPDLLVGGNYPGGIYDATNKEYVFNIARYVQGLLNDLIEDRGLFIQSNGTAVSAYRVPINGGSATDRPIKLELVYQLLPN
jgi:hypothetical protein